ncbi:MAG: prepilin-type N-terminal cleavage/methylation domain-containing protein [Polyangiales bacterium]
MKRMTPKAMRSRTRAKSAAGFTIIEVLVALGLTSVVAIGLFTLSRVATQTFQQQQRVSEMQLRLRSAVEMLRSDLTRAGYHGTPNSASDPTVCPRPVVPVVSVAAALDTPNPTFLAGDNQFIQPVVVQITGNMSSTDEYKIGAVVLNRVRVQHRWDEWERVRSAQDMDRIFSPGRLVRLRGLDGSMQFGTVRSTDYRDARQPIANMPAIDLEQPVVVNDGTTSGCGLNSSLGWIAPVSTIEYRIMNAAGIAANAYVGSAPFIDGKMDLVRREMRRTGGMLQAVPGSELLVAEYAVDFAIGAVFDEGALLTSEPRTVRYGFNDPVVFQRLTMPGAGTSQSHRLRAITFRLSVRDRTQDPEFGWTQRGSAAEPLTRFRVSALLPGAARVRTATGEVSLVNTSTRNLR